MPDQWDHSTDVLIIGSGNGALTAALCCYEMGNKKVSVVEKHSQYGGTSAMSGGDIWIPNNHMAKKAGALDSTQEAESYLNHAIPDGIVPKELIDTYLEEAPKMLEFLHHHTRARYRSLADYPDYYSDLPGAKSGHRSMEPEPLMISDLGDEWSELHDAHPMLYLFKRITFSQKEAWLLSGQKKGWLLLLAKLIVQHGIDFPWLLKSKKGRRITTGRAGVARLRLSMLDRKMPLWLNTQMTELHCDDKGKVTGITALRDGEKYTIAASQAVLLAAGGFEHNQQMRDHYLPPPTNGCDLNLM